MASSIARPARGCTARLAATTWRNDSLSFAAASSQIQAPSGKFGSTSAATCTARRVLPTPPTPVIVTSSRFVQRGSDRGDLLLATHERRGLHRKVAAEGVERLQRREVASKFRVHELEDADRRGEIAELVLAEIDELGLGVERVGNQFLGGEREHDLPTVRDRHQPCRPVERGAVVVAFALLRGAGVDAHAHAQGARLAPLLRR